MPRILSLALAGAAALALGAGFAPAPAQASPELLVKVAKRDGHHGGRHRGHAGRKHHRGGRHRHGRNHRDRSYWGYRPGYWGGVHCRIDQRRIRVRVRDPYYGWYVKTVWRPVHICR